jgi:hypothetical protein
MHAKHADDSEINDLPGRPIGCVTIKRQEAGHERGDCTRSRPEDRGRRFLRPIEPQHWDELPALRRWQPVGLLRQRFAPNCAGCGKRPQNLRIAQTLLRAGHKNLRADAGQTRVSNYVTYSSEARKGINHRGTEARRRSQKKWTSALNLPGEGFLSPILCASVPLW